MATATTTTTTTATEGGGGIGGCLPRLRPSLRRKGSKDEKRRTFRKVSAEIFYQISVVRLLRLKLLAKGTAGGSARLTQSADLLEGATAGDEGELLPRTRSAPVLPNWHRSLSTTQALEKIQSAGRIKAACSARSNGLVWKEKAAEGGAMCKRDGLRNLWKRYFLALPLEVSNLKKHPEAEDVEDVRSLLSQECACHHPCGTERGAEAVAGYLQRFRDVDVAVELVHNYVDEDASVTFSEYLFELPADCGADGGCGKRKEKKRKRFRVCEVISWDLSPYTLAGAGGECERGKILKSRGLPTLKEVFIYGKGMNLLPNSDLPPPAEGFARDGALGPVVKSYIKALLENDYRAIFSMLCSNFRISAFDGVKTRDSFVAWLLRTTEDTEDSVSRTIRDVFVDHKCRTAYLELHLRCAESSAVVVNVVQWDLRFECIINIREYGAGFKSI